MTSQLCSHLNSAARHEAGWDILQFRTEEPDELHKNRKIDLVPAPCDATICIEGRSYTDFDALLPIECKRLPTPKGNDRDEREYVFSRYRSTGGIQRFKAGHHGAAHTIGAMIGFIQEETAACWHKRVLEWISDLTQTAAPGWTIKDGLSLESDDRDLRMAVLNSLHSRVNASPIELCHLWLEMV